MDSIKNLVEYYDELFPVTEAQKKLFTDFSKGKMPARYLRISCGSGLFESSLSKLGHDVTGIDSCDDFIATANLRRRSQLMAVRFFHMDYTDMAKFLGKGFYDVISIIDSRIMFIHEKEKIKNLMADVKKLLAPNGVFIMQLANFEKYDCSMMFQLPIRESLRVKLFAEIYPKDSNGHAINMNLEKSSGKIVNILNDFPVHPLLPEEIEKYAEQAGFVNADFYADYDKTPFTGAEDSYVVVLK